MEDEEFRNLLAKLRRRDKRYNRKRVVCGFVFPIEDSEGSSPTLLAFHIFLN